SGMVLLVGGASSASAELYDPDIDKFTATGSLVKANQSGLAATLLNKGHVLITGLTSGGTPAADAELYTPSFHPLGTATLSSSDPSAPPDTFADAGTCLLMISTAGTSTCSTNVTPGEVGNSPHTIMGSYTADSMHSTSSGSANLTVTPAPTTTTVISNPTATY